MNEFTRIAMAFADEMVKAKATENHANLYGSLARWKEWGDKYEAARSALLAHLEGGEQKWLPIETAPKDGELVMLFVPTTYGKWAQSLALPGRWFMTYWVTYNQDEAIARCEPTHWCPRPATPTEEASK